MYRPLQLEILSLIYFNIFILDREQSSYNTKRNI